MKSSLDVVVPVYNPSLGWAEMVLRQFTKFRNEHSDYVIRLILVNDGSTESVPLDQGLKFLSEKLVDLKAIHLKLNAGKGAALRAGFAVSEADYTLFTDVDFPYEVASMSAMIEPLSKGIDITLGYREQDYYASVPWFRKGLSEVFRCVLQRILKFPITDTQCGLKAMNAIGREVFLETTIDGFLIDMEFIKRALKRSSIEIQPVVVKLRRDVVFSKMGASVLLREGFNFIKVLFI